MGKNKFKEGDLVLVHSKSTGLVNMLKDFYERSPLGIGKIVDVRHTTYKIAPLKLGEGVLKFKDGHVYALTFLAKDIVKLESNKPKNRR